MSTVGDTSNYRTYWRFFSQIGWAAGSPAKALFSRDADVAEWYRRTISRRCGETHQTSSISEARPTPGVDVSGPCGKGDKAQNRSYGVVGETCAHYQAVLKSVIHQKQAIADSSGQAATVWDLGGQPAKDSGKEYSRLFKEITGALKWVPRNANRSAAQWKSLSSLQRKLHYHQHQTL